MKKLLLLLAILLPFSCHAQGVRIDDSVDINTNTAVGYVLKPGNGATVSLSSSYCTSANCTATTAASLTADANGNYGFWGVPCSTYTATISGSGITTYTRTFTTPPPVSSNGTITNCAYITLNAQNNASAIVGNSAAQTFYTYTIPAGTVTGSQAIHVKVGYSHSTGAASVTYRLRLNAQNVFSLGAGVGDTGAITTDLVIQRTGATTGVVTGNGFVGNSTLGVAVASTLTGLAWGSDQVLLIDFNVANTNQVTPILWKVVLEP